MKEIEVFRKIGKRLFEKMPEILRQYSSGDFIKIGASGDRTYPVDQKAEEIIIDELDNFHSEGERFSLISEEYGFKDYGDRVRKILVDPIDGSNNARRGIPFYSTSIAFVDGENLENTRAGYIINLVNGDEFWAIRGEGAYMSKIPFPDEKRIRTSGDTEIGIILYEAASPSRDIVRIIPLIKRSNRTRCLGSTALDFSYLAKGSYSLLIIPFPSRSFDYAAGWIILKEAGGITTDLDGNDIGKTLVGVGRTVSILASANREIHKKAIEIVRREFDRKGPLAHRTAR